MLLLYSSTIPVVEYASVSLLLKNSHDGSSSSSGSMGESIIVASPLSTTTSAAENLIELHDYLNSVYEKVGSNKEKSDRKRRSAYQLGHDDGTLLQSAQVFRPTRGYGMGLYYQVVREKEFSRACFGVLMGRYARSVDLDAVNGVVICCGVAGLSTSHVSSSLVNKIVARMQETIGNMRRIGNTSDPEQCKVCYKALLSSMMIAEDEERRTNAMVDAEIVRIALDLDDGEPSRPKFKSKRAATPRGHLRKGLSAERITLETLSSADWARMMEKRSAVLSVAEKDASLRKYEASGQQRRTTIDLGKSRIRRRRKAVDEADLKEFEFNSSFNNNKWRGRDHSTSSSKESSHGKPLQRPQKDTPRIPAPPRTTAVPTLTAPRVGPARRTSQSIKKQTQRQAAFDVFGVEETQPDEQLNGSFNTIQFPGLPGNSIDHSMNAGDGSWASSQDNRQRNATGFDPFAVDSEAGTSTSPTLPSTPSSGVLTPVSATTSLNTRTKAVEDDDTPRENGRISSNASREETPSVDLSPARKAAEDLGSIDGSEATRGRIQVNIALNEDLTCSYKQSKISSCTIEGVVQVRF